MIKKAKCCTPNAKHKYFDDIITSQRSQRKRVNKARQCSRKVMKHTPPRAKQHKTTHEKHMPIIIGRSKGKSGKPPQEDRGVVSCRKAHERVKGNPNGNLQIPCAARGGAVWLFLSPKTRDRRLVSAFTEVTKADVVHFSNRSGHGKNEPAGRSGSVSARCNTLVALINEVSALLPRAWQQWRHGKERIGRYRMREHMKVHVCHTQLGAENTKSK